MVVFCGLITYCERVNEKAIKAYQILVVVLSCLHKSSITRYRLVKTGDVWLILTVLRFYLSLPLGSLTDGTQHRLKIKKYETSRVA